MIQAKLEKWEYARAAMGTAIRLLLKGSQGDGLSTFMTCLQEYKEIILGQQRVQDFVEIFRNSGSALRELLSKQISSYIGLCMTFNEVFRRIQDPQLFMGEMLEMYGSQDDKTRTFGLALFAALVRRADHTQTTIDFHTYLMSLNIYPYPEDTSLFCKLLEDTRSSDEALQLYSTMLNQYKHLPHIVLSRALTTFSRQGRENEAGNVWNRIGEKYTRSKRDILAYARLFAQLGQVQKTEEIMAIGFTKAEMITNATCLTLLLSAHLEAGNIGEAERYLEMINAIEPAVHAFNRILTYHARSANLESAIDVFDRIYRVGLQPNLESFTTLISLFANRRDSVNAENIYQAMIESGIEPDAICLAAVMNAQIEAGDWSAAADRWSRLPAKLQNNRDILTLMLKASVLLSSPLVSTTQLFRNIDKPPPHAWSLIIQSACDSGDMVSARDLYEEMDAKVSRDPSALGINAYVFTILLHGYLRVEDGQSAREVFNEMRRRGIVPSSITYGVVIRSFATLEGAQSIERAEQFAMAILKQSRDGLLSETSRSRGKTKENLMGPLITQASRNKQVERAQTLFNMATEDHPPSLPMYTKLLDAYRRGGDVDSVLSVWNKIYAAAMQTTSNHHGTALNISRPSKSQSNILCIPLSIAMDALSSVGRFLDIQEIWSKVQQAGFGFDSANCNHYAVALARTGDVEGAFNVVENILLPRSDEVERRRHANMRHETDLPLLDAVSDSLSDPDVATVPVADFPVDPAMKPPNRREENRYERPMATERDQQSGSSIRPPTQESLINMLKRWRPNDITWKPSLLTIAVLEHAYSQIQGRSGVLVGIGADDEGESGLDGGVAGEGGNEGGTINLTDFGGVTLKDHRGETRKTTPALFLARLNRKYARAVALVMFHRKKSAEGRHGRTRLAR